MKIASPTLLRTVFLVSAVLGLPHLIQAAPRWRMLDAPHCRILSRLPEDDTRRWAAEFEQFTDAALRLLEIEEAALPPLTVVLFDRTKDFAPYAPPDANGRPAAIDGFFGNQHTWSIIGLAKGFATEETRHTIYHEATHWLLTGTETETPLWLNEGLAEALATFRPDTGTGTFGAACGSHAEWLQSHPMPAFREIVEADAASLLYKDPMRNRSFYAASWIFTHRLLFGEGAEGLDAIRRHRRLRLAGSGVREAFEKTFGTEYAELGQQLSDYLHTGRFSGRPIKMGAAGVIDAPFEAAPRSVVESTLGRLAFAAGQTQLARDHIAKARALAPDAVAPLELEAMAALAANKPDAAGDAARRAIALGSRDAWMHIILGNEELHRQNRGLQIGLNLRPAADHFVSAAQAQPQLHAAYAGFAAAAAGFTDATRADLRFLEGGSRRFPDDMSLRIGVGALLLRTDQPGKAIEVLNGIKARGSELSMEDRENCERLLTEAQIDSRAEQIVDLIQQSRFDEATTAIESFARAKYGPQYTLPVASRAVSFRHRLTLAQARVADGQGHPEKGIHAIDQFLLEPQIPAILRRSAEEARAHLQKRSAQIGTQKELRELGRLVDEGNRNREALELCNKLLRSELDSKTRSELLRHQPALRFDALLEGAWEKANNENLPDAVALLEPYRYDTEFSDDNRARIEALLVTLRERARALGVKLQ